MQEKCQFAAIIHYGCHTRQQPIRVRVRLCAQYAQYITNTLALVLHTEKFAVWQSSMSHVSLDVNELSVNGPP